MASLLKPFSGLLKPGILQVPTGQLAIDFTHPLANGLMCAYLPGVMGGIDLVGNGPTLQADTAAVFDDMQEGAGLKSTAGNMGMFGTPAASLAAFTKGTLYWRGYVFGNSSAGETYFGINYSFSNISPHYVYALTATGAGDSLFITVNDGGTQHNFFSNVFNGANVIQSMAATFVVAGSINYYKNGVNTLSTSWVGASGPSWSGGPLVINAAGDNLSTTFANAICTCAYLWNRDLTSAEIAALDQAPYDFIVPAEYDLPIMLPPPPPIFILMPQIVM